VQVVIRELVSWAKTLSMAEEQDIRSGITALFDHASFDGAVTYGSFPEQRSRGEAQRV
jgi:hypothetical protein